MHMADALLSPVVGGVMCAASAGSIAYAAVKIKKDDLGEKKIPIMAVTGAFVFAAQMINFTIPGTGSSGHIGGGILLAGVLGGTPALLSLAAVLIIQCLFFADGGLLALGCNIFNMGVLPCLLVYPLLFRPLLRKKLSKGRIMWVSILSVVVGLQLGAFGVVLQTSLSGITALPFATFAALMQPIHLAIGLVEGIVTGTILCFVFQMRPELLESALYGGAIPRSVSVKRVVITLAVLALLVGGGLSLLASSNPDGLEWAIENITGSAELEAQHEISGAADIQNASAFMPDYDYKDGEGTGTSVAGLVGAGLTFLVAGATGFAITAVKKHKKKQANPS